MIRPLIWFVKNGLNGVANYVTTTCYTWRAPGASLSKMEFFYRFDLKKKVFLPARVNEVLKRYIFNVGGAATTIPPTDKNVN